MRMPAMDVTPQRYHGSLGIFDLTTGGPILLPSRVGDFCLNHRSWNAYHPLDRRRRSHRLENLSNKADIAQEPWRINELTDPYMAAGHLNLRHSTTLIALTFHVCYDAYPQTRLLFKLMHRR
jgi:hypothetical protein